MPVPVPNLEALSEKVHRNESGRVLSAWDSDGKLHDFSSDNSEARPDASQARGTGRPKG